MPPCQQQSGFVLACTAAASVGIYRVPLCTTVCMLCPCTHTQWCNIHSIWLLFLHWRMGLSLEDISMPHFKTVYWNLENSFDCFCQKWSLLCKSCFFEEQQVIWLHIWGILSPIILLTKSVVSCGGYYFWSHEIISIIFQKRYAVIVKLRGKNYHFGCNFILWTTTWALGSEYIVKKRETMLAENDHRGTIVCGIIMEWGNNIGTKLWWCVALYIRTTNYEVPRAAASG